MSGVIVINLSCARSKCSLRIFRNFFRLSQCHHSVQWPGSLTDQAFRFSLVQYLMVNRYKNRNVDTCEGRLLKRRSPVCNLSKYIRGILGLPQHAYPKLEPGGIFLIDDWHLQGSVPGLESAYVCDGLC